MEIDSLELKIEAESGQAAQNLDNVIYKLGLMNKALDNGLKNNSFKQFASNLGGISDKIEKVSDVCVNGFNDVVDAINGLSSKKIDFNTSNAKKTLRQLRQEAVETAADFSEQWAKIEANHALSHPEITPNSVSSKLPETAPIDWSKVNAYSEKAFNEINFSEVKTEADSVMDKIAKLRDEFADVGKDFKFNGSTFEELQKEIDKTEKKLNDLYERELKATKLGNIDTSSFKSLEYDISRLENKLFNLQNTHIAPKVAPIVNSGTATSVTSAAAEVISSSSKIAPVLSTIKNTGSSAFSKVMATGVSAFSKIKSAAITAGGTIKNFIATMKTGFSALKTFGSFAIKPYQLLGNALGRCIGMFRIFSHSANTANGSMMGMLGRSLMFTAFYRSISLITQGFKDGSDQLVQYSSTYNNSISSMYSALMNLRYAFVAAFSPIINFVAPMISSFINMLVDGVNAIGQFFAALTGKSMTVIAAKNNRNYAASLQDVGKAAKGAGKSAKQAKKDMLGLAAFDQLNVLNSNKANGGGGGGGAGGGAGAGGLTPQDLFKTVKVDPKISDFVQKIKDAWKKADFTEIGQIVGTKLKGALNKAEAFLDGPAKTLANKLGKSIATFINGFVSVKDLGGSIGRTLASAINLAFNFMNSFVKNLDWAGVGNFIADGINGFAKKIDTGKFFQNFALVANGIASAINSIYKKCDFKFIGSKLAKGLNDAIALIKPKEIGKALSNVFNAAIDVFKSFVDKFDFKKFGTTIGKSLTSAIKNLKWADFGKSLGTFATGLLDTLDGILKKTDWAALGKGVMTAISGFFKTFKWSSVSSTLSHIGSGLWDLLKGLIEGVDWVSLPKNIVNSIIDYFKGFDYKQLAKSIAGALGAAIGAVAGLITGIGKMVVDVISAIAEGFKSKVKEYGSIGRFIWEGIGGGIVKAIKGVGSWIKNNIVKPFIDGFKSAFGIASPSKVMKPYGKWIIEGVISGMSGAIGGLITIIGKIKDKIVDAFKNFKDNFLSVGSDIVSGISSGIEKGWSALSSFLSTTKSDIVNVFSDIKSKFESKGKSILAGISKGIENNWDKLKTNLLNTKENIVDCFKGFKNSLAKKGKLIIDGISKGVEDNWGTLKKQLKDTRKSIVSCFEGFKNSLAKKGKLIIDGISKGVGDNWKELENYLKDTRKDIVSCFDGFKDSLAKKGRLIISGISTGISQKWESLEKYLGKVVKGIVDNLSSSKYVNIGKTIVSGIKTGISNAWSNFSTWLGDKVSSLASSGKSILEKLKYGGFNPKAKTKAVGGRYSNGHWSSIPQKFATGGYIPNVGEPKRFAAGGIPNTGTLFWAGEAGAEVVAHASGGTEVLNQSQIASSIAVGVRNANATQDALLAQLINKTDRVIEGIYVVADRCGIDANQVFESVRKSDKHYSKVNGHSAFAY